MSNMYAGIEDVRGRYSSFPTVSKAKGASGNTTPLRERQQFRFDRSISHLDVADATMAVNRDIRKRGKNADSGVSTRRASTADNSEQKRETSYIALWHYPPQIISQFMYDQGSKTIIKTWGHQGLTDEFVRDELDVAAGYSQVDRYPNPYKPRGSKNTFCYPILPTYSLEHAYRDYKLAWSMKMGREYTKEINHGVSPISPDENCIEVEINNRRSSRVIHSSREIHSARMPTVEEESEVEDSPAKNTRAKRPLADPLPRGAPKKARKTKTPSNLKNKKERTPPAPKKRRTTNKKRKSPPPKEKAQASVEYMAAVSTSHAKKSAENQVRAEDLADQAATEKIQLEFATGKIGPNRIAIQSDTWHERFPKMAQEYFGFNSWTDVKEMIYCAFELEHTEPTIKILKEGLNQFEQALIGLMLMESNLTVSKIANIFGYRTHSVISAVGKNWIPEWGRIGRYLSILPFMDAETIKKMESEKFVKLGLRMVAYLIDGKDFPCDTVRIDRIVNCAQQSTKLGRSAIRIITWGLACGLTYEHTDGFLGRAGEKALVRLWASNGRLQIPVGFLGLGDKGFKGTAAYYVNMNGVLYPAFLQSGTQFTHEQSGHSLGCSQGRYSIEVFYSRVTNRPSVAGIIPRNHFSYFDDYNHWAHGRANLYRPLQMPQHYKDFFGDEKKK